MHVPFIEEDSGSIYSIYHTRTDEKGDWQPSALWVEGVNAQWIRGRPLIHGEGARIYGYVYDAGSGGGSGMNEFAGVPLEAHA